MCVYSVNDSLKVFVSTHNRQAEEARTKLNELQDMLALLHEVVGSIYMYICIYVYMHVHVLYIYMYDVIRTLVLGEVFLLPPDQRRRRSLNQKVHIIIIHALYNIHMYLLYIIIFMYSLLGI